jgi:hypothetical protein
MITKFKRFQKQLPKATVVFIMSVCLSAWNKSTLKDIREISYNPTLAKTEH